MRTLTLLVITMGWLSGSFASNADSLLFKLLNSSDCGIDFINTVDTTLDKYYPYNRASRLYYYGGGGVCAADFNNDGLSDLYFVSNVGDNKLYLNKGGLKFEDATTKANVAGSPYAWSRGVALADVNQDGHMDIYICNSEYGGMGQSKNELFINNGKGIFKEKAAEYGVDDAGNSFQASFFDYDRDNDLDLFLITHIQEKEGMKTFASNDRIKAGCQKDKLLRNDDGKFVDVTEFSGIENCASAVNVITTDLTGDGWPDIFLQNDFSVPDRIFVNQQDSTFKEQSQQYFGHYSFSSKGGDVGDVNNDGHLDLFTLDVYPEDLPTRKLISRLVVPAAMKWLSKENLYNQKQQNCLFLGNGNHYDEIAHFAGVHSTNYSWGGRLADLDNDGFQDIVISNAAVLNSILVNYGTGSTTPASMFDRKIMPSALSNYVFKNNGDLTFSNKVDQWGLSKAVNSNGLVVEDLDNDGDLDLVFNNLNSLSAVYENRSEKLKNNFVKIRLLKNKKVSDLGATAWVYHGGEVQIAQTLSSRGYLSSSGENLHVGLGNQRVDSIRVRWTDGTFSVHRDIKRNMQVNIVKPANRQEYDSSLSSIESILLPGPELPRSHNENGLIDFRDSPLLPYMLSRNGPGMAVGDIDRNGKYDLIIGGATDQPVAVFEQSETGAFNQTNENSIFKEHAKYEDMGLLLFDADNDNDLDLYMVSGGNKHEKGDELYRDRLYLNNGLGAFEYAQNRIPDNIESGSCVVAADYDSDGDLDLFIGGHHIPRHYPNSPKSYLLENNEGHFTDVTDSICDTLRFSGMVNAALWSDYDNDGDPDLLIASDWAPIRLFENKEGQLNEITQSTNLKDYKGWWNSLNGGDFDNDGDMDYIAGNLGTNHDYSVSDQQSLLAYVTDITGNSKPDALLAYKQDGVIRPLKYKICSELEAEQFKSVFGSGFDLVQTDRFTVLGDSYFENAPIEANYFPTAYIENRGADGFKVTALPSGAQFAPVYGSLIDDFNEDGNLDVLLTGNSNSHQLETGNFDALGGRLLSGDGKGGFVEESAQESGISLQGEPRSIVQIVDEQTNEAIIIAARNDSTPMIYRKVCKSTRYLTFDPDVTSGVLHFRNGVNRKFELYRGSGYLSGNARFVTKTPSISSMTIFNVQGDSATVKLKAK